MNNFVRGCIFGLTIGILITCAIAAEKTVEKQSEKREVEKKFTAMCRKSPERFIRMTDNCSSDVRIYWKYNDLQVDPLKWCAARTLRFSQSRLIDWSCVTK
jgi:hypothetical protein